MACIIVIFCRDKEIIQQIVQQFTHRKERKRKQLKGMMGETDMHKYVV